MTTYTESGDYQKASITLGLEIVLYKLNPDYLEKFKRFYNTEIRHWLQENSVGHANAWIVGDYLVVVSSTNMPPWDAPVDKGGIKGLGPFLAHPKPIPMQELDRFTLSSKPGPAGTGYAAD